jgi:uncharacterized protein YciI
MKTRFVFCYQMIDDPVTIRETVPDHIAYWRDAALDHYLGGPFADRSGGLITFAASDLDEATRIAGNDPFLRSSLLRDWWVREWLPESGDRRGSSVA